MDDTLDPHSRKKRGPKDPDNVTEATVAAMKLLTRRSHARQELRRKLRASGFTVRAVENALETCTEKKWLDDQSFAQHNATLLIDGGKHGPRYIIEKLVQHGVQRSLAEQVVETLGQDINWTERAKHLLEKKLGDDETPDLADLARARRFLAARGFELSHILAALPDRS